MDRSDRNYLTVLLLLPQMPDLAEMMREYGAIPTLVNSQKFFKLVYT
ncbi:hypothetical protein NIES25_44950 [Nostoc linckia NIES-25]|nr:hypothetical protein NIES25_44950 [Nostoc linckia NIES-25]